MIMRLNFKILKNSESADYGLKLKISNIKISIENKKVILKLNNVYLFFNNCGR